MDATQIHLIRKLAIEAGRKIMEIYETPDFGVDIKPDNSPVTLADKAADVHIYNGLRSAFPDSVVVTEEQTQTHSLKAGAFFIVDPLDGTKDFIRRGKDFTVNIAYVVDEIPVFGIIYAPARKRLFYTNTQRQAVEEFGDHNPNILDPDKILESKVLRVNPPDNNALCFIASYSHSDSITDHYIKSYKPARVDTAGSSLKFCLVAAGQADIYPRLGPTMEWDTAAGHAILSAAGGHVVDFNTHAPLRYGKAGFRNPLFIAYSAGVQLKQGDSG